MIMLNAVAWKEDMHTKEESGIKYRLQVNEVPPRSVKKLFKNLKDWSPSGEGYCFKNDKRVFLFSKVFVDVKEWRTWARKFPYSLREIDERTGKEKRIKLGTNVKN